MGGVPDQVEGCEPNNDGDKDGKMDKETAQRRSCETELLRRRPRSLFPSTRFQSMTSSFTNFLGGYWRYNDLLHSHLRTTSSGPQSSAE